MGHDAKIKILILTRTAKKSYTVSETQERQKPQSKRTKIGKKHFEHEGESKKKIWKKAQSWRSQTVDKWRHVSCCRAPRRLPGTCPSSRSTPAFPPTSLSPICPWLETILYFYFFASKRLNFTIASRLKALRTRCNITKHFNIEPQPKFKRLEWKFSVLEMSPKEDKTKTDQEWCLPFWIPAPLSPVSWNRTALALSENS